LVDLAYAQVYFTKLTNSLIFNPTFSIISPNTKVKDVTLLNCEIVHGVVERQEN